VAELTLDQQKAVAMASARLRLQQQQPEAPERIASAGDKALGSIPGRIALGASQVITGPLQLGANIGDKISEAMGHEPVVGRAVNATLNALEESKRRGMKARGVEGYDWAGLAGTLATGAGALKGVAPAVSTLGKIAQGSAVGAGFGAAAPVTDGGDKFFTEKALQTGTGAVLGAGIPSTTAVVGAAGKFVGQLGNLITPGGPARIATNFQKEIVGEGNLKPVIDALRNVKTNVPGSKPTAAEALVGVPEGSPVIAQQAVTSKTAGGVSAQFGQRALDQQAAMDVAETALDKATKPMRSAALAAANRGGTKSQPVTALIDKFANLPTFKPDKVVQGAMAELKQTIADNTDANGVINANALYTIRKNIGTTIAKFSKENASWNKNVTAILVRNIQKRIDSEIERAGGKGWKAYLAQYASGKKAIETDVERTAESLKPLQKTLLAGSSNITGSVTGSIPNLLSPPAMIANAVLKWIGMGVEPRVDAVMAQRFLDPATLADVLEKATPSQRAAVTAELWKQYGRTATIGAPVTAAAEAEGQ